MNLEERKDILNSEETDSFFKELLDNIGSDTEKAGEEVSKAFEEFEDAGKPKLFFAKVDRNATIPTKRDEDAGRDIYPLIQPRETAEGLVYEQYLKKGKVSTVNTGIASAMSEDYYLSLNSERSSVGKYGLNVLAGVVDSGYRGEIKLMLTPLVKDVLISSMVEEVEEHEDLIVMPYKKAIAQATLLPVPDVVVEELEYGDLLEIKSERGLGGWGSSGK